MTYIILYFRVSTVTKPPAQTTATKFGQELRPLSLAELDTVEQLQRNIN